MPPLHPLKNFVVSLSSVNSDLSALVLHCVILEKEIYVSGRTQSVPIREARESCCICLGLF